MNITAIYATPRKAKSSTYQIAQAYIQALLENGELHEFFLPAAMPSYCASCWNCFEHKEKCPHYEYVKPLTDAMLASDLIIITAPVYALHAPAQLKSLMDHFACCFIPHRPYPEMMRKQALVISTAAGAGMGKTIRDVADSLDMWGVGRLHTYKKAIFSAGWDDLKPDMQSKMLAKANAGAAKIKAAQGFKKPRIKVRALFYAMRYVQTHITMSKTDHEYWKEHGWLDGKKPWEQLD